MHFAEYWRRYRAFVNSKGDNEKLKDLFDGEIPTEFDWRDFSVIRIPYELVPKGFMDDKHVARAKGTVNSSIYQSEYGAVFAKDSDGFFKRSLIETCVGTDLKPVMLQSGEVWFDAALIGKKGRKYIIGVDPASEQDNFSIVVVELMSDHRRIVYCWSTTRAEFKKRKKVGLTADSDFYGYCARRIRQLMSKFPIERIGCDAQGGGIAVEEALHDLSKLGNGELPVWPIIDDDKPKDSDYEHGLHILEMVQFAKLDWTAEANHGLKKDFEDKRLLFPRFDPATLELSAIADSNIETSMYDSLEDCVMEIEELKYELSIIQHQRTPTGKERWDTPEIKLQNGRKGRMRKDRYSALLIANMIARQMDRVPTLPSYEMVGNLVVNIDPKKTHGVFYTGPEWFTNAIHKDGICLGVTHEV